MEINEYVVDVWSNGKKFKTTVIATSIKEAEQIIEEHITFEYQIINVQKNELQSKIDKGRI